MKYPLEEPLKSFKKIKTVLRGFKELLGPINSLLQIHELLKIAATTTTNLVLRDISTFCVKGQPKILDAGYFVLTKSLKTRNSEAELQELHVPIVWLIIGSN